MTNHTETAAAQLLGHVNGFVFLAVKDNDRIGLATTIERLINMLDEMDTDPDLELSGDEHDFSIAVNGAHSRYQNEDDEQCGDLEPSMGSQVICDQTAWASGSSEWDECEEENEHGGNITDEPHDMSDEGDYEPFLGWTEKSSQHGVGATEPFTSNIDMSDENFHAGNGAACRFLGDGYSVGKRMLMDLSNRRPDVHQEYVRTSPGAVAAWRV